MTLSFGSKFNVMILDSIYSKSFTMTTTTVYPRLY